MSAVIPASWKYLDFGLPYSERCGQSLHRILPRLDTVFLFSAVYQVPAAIPIDLGTATYRTAQPGGVQV